MRALTRFVYKSVKFSCTVIGAAVITHAAYSIITKTPFKYEYKPNGNI